MWTVRRHRHRNKTQTVWINQMITRLDYMSTGGKNGVETNFVLKLLVNFKIPPPHKMYSNNPFYLLQKSFITVYYAECFFNSTLFPEFELR